MQNEPPAGRLNFRVVDNLEPVTRSANSGRRLRMRGPSSQVGFDAALKGFVGLAGNESFAEDAVAVNDVSDGARDIRLDVEASNARTWVDAAFDERHACEFGELGLLLGRLVGDRDDD